MAGRLRWRGLRAESVDSYSGVLVPLDQAHLHSHSARCGRTEFEELSANSDEEDDPKDGAGDEGTGMLEMSAAEYSIEGLRKEVRRGGGGMRSDYELKSMLVNKAVQDIGMGRYNWQLFVLCGFGWFADNLWMQGVSLILPSLSAEFGIAEKTVRYTTSAVYLGLCFGSFTWGVGSDILGRRIAFNMTLLITSIFGIMTAFATSWAWVCIFFSLLGFGVGGNLPVDGALFLEFLPDTSSSLLTLLSVWWPVGQLCSSFIAWFFIGNWPADRGWRLFVLAIGLITFGMFCLRFFIFHLFESPKYLLSRGRQSEAVAVVHGLAYRNGAKTWLSEAVLDAVVDSDDRGDDRTHVRGNAAVSALSTKSVIKSKLDEFSGARLRPLFSSRKLGLATALVWFTWATIGMGYPLFNAFLPQYLSHSTGGGGDSSSSSTPPREADPTDPTKISAETYRNYAILSVVGVPGSILAYFTVDSQSAFLGRRGTLAISTFISASFLFLFVRYGTTSASQLAFSCVEAFSQNIMYGVLYAFTPEIFPAPVRGAGTGVASFLNRFTGLIAPILAANIPGDGASAPIYLAGALIFAAFVGIVLIPIETRGRQRL
ncbi:membrane transporter [Diaporthe sp. PMI_573]|nr:membrane transporter [Diaporthaceae sp. PMI_573]